LERPAGERRGTVSVTRSVDALHAVPSSRGEETRRPTITDRWLRNVAFTNRLAFEQEMKRERRRRLDPRLERFLKRTSARQA
jgi:hypothetical protein